jgi:vitamin B12 transporter
VPVVIWVKRECGADEQSSYSAAAPATVSGDVLVLITTDLLKRDWEGWTEPLSREPGDRPRVRATQSTLAAGRRERLSMSPSLKLALCAGISALCLPQGASAQNQAQQQGPGQPSAAQVPLFVTVTANRSPTSIQRTGSAITTVSEEEIRNSNPATFADVLRSVPGVSLTESGGPGGVTSLRLRGNDARHTLVLVDGIRVNDPTDVGGGFDFGGLAVRDIERIEVLRGPQSALYGSDAIGGVVNIITKRGRGKPQSYLQVEGGSYGTRSVRAGISGSTETMSYAFGLHHLNSDGFSRFGQRVRRIESIYPKLEADPIQRSGASGRVSWRPVAGVEFEVGGQFSKALTRTDNAFGLDEDTAGKDQQTSGSGFAKATIDTLEGRWRHSLTAFTSFTNRRSRCDVPGFTCYYQDPADRLTFNPADRVDTGFKGSRIGAEYQGDIKLGAFGTLIIGAKHEKEQAKFTSDALLPIAIKGYSSSADRRTNSIFALHQFRLGERTDISIGGRVDKPNDTDAFLTWRGTVAHRITETGTKLRASIGTGAKAPSLYQQFSEYGPLASGRAALQAEKSLGYDVGVDQDLWDGRARFSITAFENRLKNAIEFDGTRGLVNPVYFYNIGQYVNLSRALTRGIELAGTVDLIPGHLRARASFTFQDARAKSSFGSVVSGDRLLRRPEEQGSFALTFTPNDKLTIEPFVTYVGRQVDIARAPGTFSSVRKTLPAYVTVGVRTEYKLNDNLKVYVRGENLTNERYEEIYNYGTVGRSVYAGIRATW